MHAVCNDALRPRTVCAATEPDGGRRWWTVADRLTVDLDGLEHFSASLETIRSELGSARSWMREHHGDLGGREVDAALGHFESRWRDGRGRVDENCKKLIGLVDQAVEHLRTADEDLRSSLVEGTKSA